MYDGKYINLYDFLLGMSASANFLTLTFGEIEGILQFKLPDSAKKYPAWWANQQDGKHSHAHSWLYAGWKTSKVDICHKVTFEKNQQS